MVNATKVDVCVDLRQEGALHGVLSGCDMVIHLAADGRPQADFITEVNPSNIQESLGPWG